MRRDPFLESVLDTIRTHGLLQDGDEVVVGVSGGPDSVALLRALCWIRDRGRIKCWLCVAHLNHMLRPREAAGDADFVKRLAARMNCPCFDGAVDVRALADAQRLSIEEAAREARYTYLEQVCLGVEAGKVAVGHTADDNVETVLQRILRGAGPAGLAGIPPMRRCGDDSPVHIIRPLLGTPRADVEAFLRRRRQTYRVDSSNFSSQYMRNRVRHTLLPLLESQFNGNVREAIAGLSHICGDVTDFLKETAAKVFENLDFEHRDRGIAVPVAQLREVHPAVLPWVMRSVLDTMCVGLKQITRRHYAAIGRLVVGGGGEKQIALPYGLRAVRSGAELRIERGRRAAKRAMDPTELPVPGLASVPNSDVTIACEVIEGGENILREFVPYKNRLEEMVDLDRLALPLVVRARRRGERFHPLGAKGGQTLQDFMVDQKIPREERARLPIVADRRHAVWIVGHRIDDRAKVTSSTTRVLKLRAEPY